jgi:hypothetical protein
VTALQWYPADNGLFASGSTDGFLRLYDVSHFAVAAAFEFRSGPVADVSLPPPTAPHSLAAVCFAQRADIRLCDLRSGSVAQSLRGHGGQLGSSTRTRRDIEFCGCGITRMWITWMWILKKKKQVVRPCKQFFQATIIFTHTGRNGPIFFFLHFFCLEILLPISFPPLRDEELGDVRRVVDADMVIPPRQRSRPNREPNYDLGVHSVDWSPQDPTALLSAGGDGSVRLWDIRMTANCVASFNVDARHAGGSAGAEPRDADELRGGVGAL